MLMTFDEHLKPIQVITDFSTPIAALFLSLLSSCSLVQVPVRVGQAVDTVGQAGRPKTITGFQTHTTPVLLGFGERAELATDECTSLYSSLFTLCIVTGFTTLFFLSHHSPQADIPLTSILEGFVILKPNPDASPKI
jgi:hypothetical protein